VHTEKSYPSCEGLIADGSRGKVDRVVLLQCKQKGDYFWFLEDHFGDRLLWIGAGLKSMDESERELLAELRALQFSVDKV